MPINPAVALSGDEALARWARIDRRADRHRPRSSVSIAAIRVAELTRHFRPPLRPRAAR